MEMSAKKLALLKSKRPKKKVIRRQTRHTTETVEEIEMESPKRVTTAFEKELEQSSGQKEKKRSPLLRFVTELKFFRWYNVVIVFLNICSSVAFDVHVDKNSKKPG
jgi:hypothetical protein